jgi:hypothetical protein
MKTTPTEDRPVVIAIEIVARRRYAIHARDEASALEMIQLFAHDQNPTIINGRSCGGARALAIDRTRSSIERIPIEVEVEDSTDSVQVDP